MNKQHLVVIGNGMAGIRAVEQLLALAPERHRITVYGAEPHPNYNRVLLSPVLAGEQDFADIVLNDLAWYDRHAITLKSGRRVERIDREKRQVIADDGQSETYDRLLIATGSAPFVPQVPGIELDGVIGYRDIDDTRRMIETAAPGRRAVVIGGGLLGLEAANGLKLRGMAVTVVHRGRWLLERQLDEQSARLLETELGHRGLEFALRGDTCALHGDAEGRVREVELADGRRLPADLVVFAAGIRPRSELAEQAGLACERGIVVDDGMRTSDPAIYAVGECASHRGIAYGLVAPCYEQAAVCAARLAGMDEARYEGSLLSAKLKVTGIDLFSAGDFLGAEGTDQITLFDPCAGIYKKLVMKGDVLVGTCLYGDTGDGGWYLEQIERSRDLAEARDALMFGPALAREPLERAERTAAEVEAA